MKIVAVTGYKGGVGKSVTSIHLAQYLSGLGATLLVDSDPNRSCEGWAERGGRHQSFEVTNEKAMGRLVAGRDFLVLDTPARPASSELREIMEGADLTVMPTLPDAFSVTAMMQMLSAVVPEALYRVLLTVCPPPPSREAELVRNALQGVGMPLFEAQIRRAAGFVKASAIGCTVADLTGRDRLGWLDYQAVGREIAQLLGVQTK